MKKLLSIIMLLFMNFGFAHNSLEATLNFEITKGYWYDTSFENVQKALFYTQIEGKESSKLSRILCLNSAHRLYLKGDNLFERLRIDGKLKCLKLFSCIINRERKKPIKITAKDYFGKVYVDKISYPQVCKEDWHQDL